MSLLTSISNVVVVDGSLPDIAVVVDGARLDIGGGGAAAAAVVVAFAIALVVIVKHTFVLQSFVLMVVVPALPLLLPLLPALQLAQRQGQLLNFLTFLPSFASQVQSKPQGQQQGLVAVVPLLL